MIALRISVFLFFLLVAAGNVLPNTSHVLRKQSSASSQAIIPLYIIPVTRVYNPFSNRDYDDELYQIPISIGTPAADFNLTLDSHGDNGVGNVLFAKKYHHESCNFCKEDQPTRNLYKARSSSSAHVVGPLGKEYPRPLPGPYSSITCLDNNCDNRVIEGSQITDSVEALGQPLNSITFNVIKNISSLNGDWMSDGIFQYASRLRLSDVSVLHLLGGVAASNPPSLAGHLIVGGKATAGMCDEKWVTVSDNDNDLLLNRVTLGKWWTAGPKGKPIAATVGIGTAYTLVNTLTREEIVKAVGAEYDFQTDSYIVYCNTVSSLPDIVFDIGEKDGSHRVTYRIPANIYTRKAHPTAEKCLLMFDECSTYGDNACVAGEVWHLGSTFLRPYCHLMEKNGGKWTYSISKANF